MTTYIDNPPPVSPLARAVRGHFPADLLRIQPEVARLGEFGYVPPSYVPELHPLNAEWYFTDASANWLAASLPSRRTLILGVPTVAARRHTEEILVDASPYVIERFPRLRHDRLVTTDVRALEYHEEFDAVLLDPSWYFPEILDWLGIAVRALRRGGQLWMPLLLEGTRPSAPSERERLRDWLAMLGSLVIIEEAIEYDVPLYEARALRAAGFADASPWRAADLAILTLDKARDPEIRTESRSSSAQSKHWSSFRVGSQVVKVRAGERRVDGLAAVSGPLLDAVDGVSDFTLDTVSRRDPRIPCVDIWTSRNRVASTGDQAQLLEEMERLTATFPNHSRIDPMLAQLLEVES